MSSPHRLIVGPEQNNVRLDICLASTGLVSRTKARALLAAGAVYMNRQRVKVASRMVHTGDQLEFYPISPREAGPTPELAFLYRDDALVVVHKPAGMPVQPGRETDRGTVLEALAKQLGPPAREARVVHRLDTETSGAVVVALTRQAAAGLSEQMAAHSAERFYLAAVHGQSVDEETLRHYLSPLRRPHPNAPAGPARVEARSAVGPLMEDERLAITHLRCLGRTSGQAHGFSLVWLRLETGRTHQIRAQLAASGLPLVGDTRYGAPPLPEEGLLQRPALHAALLRFRHPTTGRELTLFAPVPFDLREWLELHRLWMPTLDSSPDQPFALFTKELQDGEDQRHPEPLTAG